MTTTAEPEAPPVEPLMPSDTEIDRMKKRDLLTVIASHGLPPIEKATEKELRPYARAVVHGARTKAVAEAPAPGPEPEPQPATPEVDVPLDTRAVDDADVAELEPVKPRETVPAINVWERITMMAEYLFKSSLRPVTLKNVNDVGLVLLAAYDLGIPSSFAMQKIHVQNGRMGMMGELMSALILRDGHSLRADVANDRTSARVWGKRAEDTEWTFADFTIDDAAAAGLVYIDDNGIPRARSDKENKPLPWELYTADMLYWRALARLARRHFSDCLGGISYTPDELGWAIDVEAADELTDGEKPYGRAGEPEPTMTLGRARTEMGNRLAELPEDLQADIKERWKRARLHPVKDLTAAEMRTVRGWVEAAEEISKQRDDTSHIPDAEEVTEQTEGDAEAGSAADDRDASEPAPVPEDRQEPGVSEPPLAPPGPDVADGPADDGTIQCAAGDGPISDSQEVVFGPEGEPYHEDCAPFEEGGA